MFVTDPGSRTKSAKKLGNNFSAMTAEQEEKMESQDFTKEVQMRLVKVAPKSCFAEMLFGKPAKEAKNLPMAPMDIAKDLSSDDDIVEKKKSFDAMLAITKEQQDALGDVTASQGSSELWKLHRLGRITASNFKRVFTRVETLRRKPNEDPANLLLLLTKHRELGHCKAIKHGKSMEIHAKQAYKTYIKSQHRGAKFQDAGLMLDLNHPFLGASPDLLVNCMCHGAGLCEVKCPMVTAFKDYSHLEEVDEMDGHLKLKKSSEYYYQVQGQMAISNRAYCDFYIFSKAAKPHLERIYFDAAFWEDIKEKLIYFWLEHLQPFLMQPPTEDQHDHADHAYAGANAEESCAILFPPTTKRKKETKNPLNKPVMALIFLCNICNKDIADHPDTLTDCSAECCACHCWVHYPCALRDLGRAVTDEDTAIFKNDWYCERCSSAIG